MKLTKFEQSGFILETNNGYTLAIDIASYTPLETLSGISPDAMLVSHIHGDHFSVEHIKILAPKKLYLNEECIAALGEQTLSSEIVRVQTGDTINIGDIKVSIFDVDHGPNVKVRPRENFGFLFEVDGKKVYFAGDMFTPSGIDVSVLEVDTALIPIGTFYTFGPKEAVDFIKSFKQVGKVIPMHFDNKPETEKEFVTLAVAEAITIDGIA